ncbi:MAG: hypothetical protein LQ348_003901 [Seirophora lacunosa]|nr:MAG: hypothetical protein LQ348_003901 [Seirophora lacunosa]
MVSGNVTTCFCSRNKPSISIVSLLSSLDEVANPAGGTASNAEIRANQVPPEQATGSEEIQRMGMNAAAELGSLKLAWMKSYGEGDAAPPSSVGPGVRVGVVGIARSVPESSMSTTAIHHNAPG